MSFLKKLKNKFIGKKSEDQVLEAIKESKQDINIEKYNKGLEKSREGLFKRVKLLFVKNREIDQEFFKEFEELLIMSDVGPEYAFRLSKIIQNEVKLKNIKDTNEIIDLIFEKFVELYTEDETNLELNIEKGKLNIILVIGVNGVGKTTSIAKLSRYLLTNEYKISLAAADTFRAGAVAQLNEWSTRLGINITTPEKEGQDPASVVFKAIQSAKENNDDVLIIDTAGRLQNKQNLMNELAKINKVIETQNGASANEVLLVLDATIGQNGVVQAKAFNELIKLSGIILTKMDSSSKGGIILSIKDIFNIPVKFIGLGEGLDDFEKFDINKYVFSLSKDLINNEEVKQD